MLTKTVDWRTIVMKRFFFASLSLAFVLAASQSQKSTAGSYFDKDVDLNVRMVKSASDQLVLDVNLRNNTGQAIYVAKNPVREDGTKGFYFSFDDGGKIVVVESRVFAPDRPSPYSDQTSVELKKVEPKGEFNESFTIDGKLMETVPPVRSHINSRQIDVQALRAVRVNYGFFVDEIGIATLFKGKSLSPLFNGLEPIRVGSYRGKRLFEVQKLVTQSAAVGNPG
jgi:hypothetical protein